MKKIIKISTPFDSKKIRSQINPSFLESYQFEIDSDCDVCDYWIVWGDLPIGMDKMTVKCAPEKVLFMTDEAYVEKHFNQQFLNQFASVLTCRSDIQHRSLIQTHEINIWQLDYSYSEIADMRAPQKDKNISVVFSDKLFLDGHKKRYAFVNRLIGHFKDRLDVYGSGINPINDKWEALAPYKYSIAIENSSLPDYFSEKITECYLANTLPIYWGATNIEAFFDKDSYCLIPRDNYKLAIESIEGLLDQDLWNGKSDILLKQRDLYLSQYHFFPALIRVLTGLPMKSSLKKSVTIKSHRQYLRGSNISKLIHLAKKSIQR